MFGKTFYHASIKKYVTLFGTIFNDIWINRTDSAGNVKQSFKVPIAYGPREKFLARIDDIDAGYDPQEQEFAIIQPQMSFEITNLTYAAERKTPTNNYYTRQDKPSDPTKRQYLYNMVPYDINFTLSVFVKNTEDGTQIIEQILPYFAPDWTPTIRLIDEPQVIVDVPIILQSVAQDDVYEGSWEERRTLIWTLEFVMKVNFFGPKRESGIINLANTNIFDEINDTGSRTININTYPGQLANGQPTSDALLTIDKDLIEANSEWDYINVIDETQEP